MIAAHATETSLCDACGSMISDVGICPGCAFDGLLSEGESSANTLDIEIDRYTLKRRLASGGMGVVYVAEDRQLKRTVALKMIRGATFANEAEYARFATEAEAAATLDHPHITPVYEVGVADEQPFFTMKLISGKSLASWLKGGERPGLRQYVEWLKCIAEAVQHAHERGVLHRDLKPGNVIIDEAGKPWLTDFGLAKLVHQDSCLTLSSDRLGTPHYMAPEVVDDAMRGVSTASDVWALGVMLWQCVCGKLPFRGKGPMEIMRRISDDEPSLEGSSGIDRDLLTLAQRCLEKQPKDRLPSARTFAEEADRWLRGEPLRVRRVTTSERAWKWIKRNPAWAALIAALLLGSASSLRQWQRAETAVGSLTSSNEELTDSLTRSQAVSLAFEARLSVQSDPAEALTLAVQSVEMTQRMGLDTLPQSEEALTETLQRVGGVDISPFGSRPRFQGDAFISRWEVLSWPITFSPNGRWAMLRDHHTKGPLDFASIVDLQEPSAPNRYRWNLCERKEYPEITCWLHDSRRLVRVDSQGRIWLIVPNWEGDWRDGPLQPATYMLGQLPLIGELRGTSLTRSAEEGRLICRIAVEADGEMVIETHAIRVGEVIEMKKMASHKVGARLLGDTVWRWSPDGRWVVGRHDEAVRLLRIPDDETKYVDNVILGNKGEYPFCEFSSDSSRLAFRRHANDMCLFDLRSGVLEKALESIQVCRHDAAIESIAFSADGRWVAAAGDSPNVTVATQDGQIIRRLKLADSSLVLGVAFSPDGRWLGAGSREGIVGLWPMSDIVSVNEPLELRGLPTPVLAVSFSPNSQTVIAHGSCSHYRSWPLRGTFPGRIPELVPGRQDAVSDLALSPDKQWIAIACAKDHPDARTVDGFVKLAHATGHYPERVLGTHGNFASGVAFCPTGRWLASTGADGLVNVWNLPALTYAIEEKRTFPSPVYQFDMTHTRLEYRRRVAFHPSGRLYATCGDGILFEWDLTVEDPARSVIEHRPHSIGYILPDVAVSPDGRLLALARHGWDDFVEGSDQSGNMVLLFEVGDPGILKPLTVLPACFLFSTSVRFSHDGRWLAAGASGRGAMVWDLSAEDIAASRMEAPVSAHLIGDVAFSPKNKWLSMAASDGRIHLWDWRQKRRPRTIVTGNAETALTWLDDTRLLVGGAQGHLAIWETCLENLKEMAWKMSD